MKVHRIVHDTEHYQHLAAWPPVRPEELLFDARPKGALWHPPTVRIEPPDLLAPDFWYLHPSTLVVRSSAYSVVGEFLEMAGETLPLPYQGEEFMLVNVLQCVECLDHDRVVVDAGTNEGLATVRPYAFVPHLLPGSRIFKLPETYAQEILVVEHEEDCPEDEFLAAVQEAGLCGINFELLWESQED